MSGSITRDGASHGVMIKVGRRVMVGASKRHLLRIRRRPGVFDKSVERHSGQTPPSAPVASLAMPVTRAPSGASRASVIRAVGPEMEIAPSGSP